MVNKDFRTAHGPKNLLATPGNAEGFNDLIRASGDSLLNRAIYGKFLEKAAQADGISRLSGSKLDAQDPNNTHTLTL